MKDEPVNFPFLNAEEYGDVQTVARTAGIELRNENGKKGIPYHCRGEKMQVKRGIIGPDYVRCYICNMTIYNMLSPNINGGHFFDERTIRTHGNSLWTIRRTNHRNNSENEPENKQH